MQIKLEGPFLEPFVEEPEAVAIPEQQLDAITSTVEEDKEITGERVLEELLFDDRTEAVVRLTEIDRLTSEEDSDRAGQT